MPDIDSISVAFPVKSMRSAEHFVMNATEEEARRGLTRVLVEFGELLGKVNKKPGKEPGCTKERVCIPHPINQEGV